MFNTVPAVVVTLPEVDNQDAAIIKRILIRNLAPSASAQELSQAFIVDDSNLIFAFAGHLSGIHTLALRKDLAFVS